MKWDFTFKCIMLVKAGSGLRKWAVGVQDDDSSVCLWIFSPVFCVSSIDLRPLCSFSLGSEGFHPTPCGLPDTTPKPTQPHSSDLPPLYHLTLSLSPSLARSLARSSSLDLPEFKAQSLPIDLPLYPHIHTNHPHTSCLFVGFAQCVDLTFHPISACE